LFDWSSRAQRIVLTSLVFLGLVMPAAIAQTPAPTVVAVSVTGNTHIATDRILAVVKTKVGDPFDPAVVQDDLRSINDLGFFSDQAPPVIKQRPDGVAITFRVIENPVVARINFTGNAHVPADTLLALMDTAVGQVFNLKIYQQDVLKINSYYDKIGYGGQVPTHVADVGIDAQGVLAISIREGLIVRNVLISEPPVGDPLLSPNLIRSVLLTKPGTPYSEDQRDKDVDRLKDLYKQYDLQIGDFEAGIDQSSIDLKAGTADVRYTISVMRVGAIEITGNTITHDDVIRRELRLKPGMLITDSGVRRDYDRLNNLGFFEKVELNDKPGPDPSKPALHTLDWQVKEQRTGTAQIGAGYSGGLTGTGLTGTLSYSQNNINGTGNGGSIKLERGARIADASISATIPYVGKTEQSQKYSLGGTIFTNSQTNYYPVYSVPTPTPAPHATAVPSGAPVEVSILPPAGSTAGEVSGIAATYEAKSTGINLTSGRRLSDIFRVSAGVNVSSVESQAEVPAPYYFANSSDTSLVGSACVAGTSIISSSCEDTSALGIAAPSLAVTEAGKYYALHSISIGFGADTRDDVFNPRRGVNASFSDEVSSPTLGSAFSYDQYVLDISKFFPVGRNWTFGVHSRLGTSTGAIPTNKIFTFSDQDLRGYNDVFYGTDEALFQTELRVPLTTDRKFSVVGFVDDGGTRIRGASAGIDSNGDIIDYALFTFHADVGVGLRFDVPQLGLRTIRLDFARGSEGTHTSFGIGQSF
jgi:outer membrane protein assembly factor BamA